MKMIQKLASLFVETPLTPGRPTDQARLNRFEESRKASVRRQEVMASEHGISTRIQALIDDVSRQWGREHDYRD